MSEREDVKPVECDCCGGTWGYINADGEHDNVWTCVHELTQQRDTMRRERDEARRELGNWKQVRDGVAGLHGFASDWPDHGNAPLAVMASYALLLSENDILRARAERAELVVEAARPWLADMWRGDLNGTVIGVCMEYEPDGQYVLWEQVAPIAEAVRALDAAEGTPGA